MEVVNTGSGGASNLVFLEVVAGAFRRGGRLDEDPNVVVHETASGYKYNEYPALRGYLNPEPNPYGTGPIYIEKKTENWGGRATYIVIEFVTGGNLGIIKIKLANDQGHTSYAKDICHKLLNIPMGEYFTMQPYDYTDTKGVRKIGISMKKDDETKIDWAYNPKEHLSAWVQRPNSEGELKWDKSQEEIDRYNLLQEHIKAMFPGKLTLIDRDKMAEQKNQQQGNPTQSYIDPNDNTRYYDHTRGIWLKYDAVKNEWLPEAPPVQQAAPPPPAPAPPPVAAPVPQPGVYANQPVQSAPIAPSHPQQAPPPPAPQTQMAPVQSPPPPPSAPAAPAVPKTPVQRQGQLSAPAGAPVSAPPPMSPPPTANDEIPAIDPNDVPF